MALDLKGLQEAIQSALNKVAQQQGGSTNPISAFSIDLAVAIEKYVKSGDVAGTKIV